VITVNRVALALLAVLLGYVASGSIARADCQAKPTRACVLQEALGGEGAPLSGKDRLDVLIQADALNHAEYLSPADIDEARRLATQPSGNIVHAYLAIRGLAAARQWQPAFDVVSSLGTTIRNVGFFELTRLLVKAGEADKVADFAKRLSPPPDPKTLAAETVKTLADAGKTQEALAMMATALPTNLPDINMADVLAAVATASIKRGDIAAALPLLDKEQSILEAALSSAVGASAVQLRFALIALQALRGDGAAVKTALQQFPAPPPVAGTERLVDLYRGQGYLRVVFALLTSKQFPIALDVAQSTPDPTRAFALAGVARQHALDGRLADARAVLPLLGDKADPRVRAAIIRDLAVAAAKSGDLAGAVAMAAQVSDPTSRRGVLFALAQALPQ
jgi:Flp pilus assembly protein TadD